MKARDQHSQRASSSLVRVLQLIRPAEGGIRQHVLGILGGLDPGRYELTVGAPAEFLQSLSHDEAVRQEIVPIAPLFSLARDSAASLRVAHLAAHVDIVHAHGLRAAWIASLAHLARPFPFVVTAHNLVEPDNALTCAGLRTFGRRASLIIAVSHAISDGLAAGGVPEIKIAVIPNGVDVDHFAKLPPRMSAGNFVVGCIARLSVEKGVDVLLRAAELLPNMRFIIAGDGPDRADLERIAPSNVRFLGRIADIRNVLAEADVIAIPSRLEGQGIVALEAMAAGVSIVASRVGGLAEMLTDDATALLIVPNSASELALALTRMAEDESLRQKLASQAKLLVRSEYSLPKMIESLEGVYAALLS